MMGFNPLRSSLGMGLSFLVLAACTSTPDPVPYADLPAHMQFGYDSKGKIVTNYKVGTPYEVAGKWYYPAEDYGYREEGIASWYGPGFHGKRTANGEVYDMNALTAAHKTLPMPSVVLVTNLENNRAIKLRINDRGPFVDGRIIDLSRRAAQLLDVEKQGVARVFVEIVPDDSITLKNMALNESGTRLPTPKVEAAPRQPVTAQSLDPPAQSSAPRANVEMPRANVDMPRANVGRPSSNVEAPRISANTQPSQPVIRQPSLPSQTVQPSAAPSATPSRPSLPSRPAVSSPTPPPQPASVASAPSPPRSSITRSSLPSPNTSPPPVRSVARSSAPSVSSGSGSGVNLPSVSTSDVSSAAKSAVQSQTGLQQTASDMLPSPKDMVKRAMQDDGQPASNAGETEGMPEDNRLEPPENLVLPDGVFIQAGSFSDVNNARRLEAQLSGLGNVFVSMVDVGGQTFHRVRVGPIPDETIADQLLQYMQTEGFGEARILTE